MQLSFWNIRYRCPSTVRLDTTSRSAILWLVRPRATRWAISRSRALSGSGSGSEAERSAGVRSPPQALERRSATAAASTALGPEVCILVCMARLNVYVPDDLAEQARERGLNVSALTQAAIRAELESSATAVWLEGLSTAETGVRHETVLNAVDAARDEFGE